MNNKNVKINKNPTTRQIKTPNKEEPIVKEMLYKNEFSINKRTNNYDKHQI